VAGLRQQRQMDRTFDESVRDAVLDPDNTTWAVSRTYDCAHILYSLPYESRWFPSVGWSGRCGLDFPVWRGMCESLVDMGVVFPCCRDRSPSTQHWVWVWVWVHVCVCVCVRIHSGSVHPYLDDRCTPTTH
jgi:hypothetical protein